MVKKCEFFVRTSRGIREVTKSPNSTRVSKRRASCSPSAKKVARAFSPWGIRAPRTETAGHCVPSLGGVNARGAGRGREGRARGRGNGLPCRRLKTCATRRRRRQGVPAGCQPAATRRKEGGGRGRPQVENLRYEGRGHGWPGGRAASLDGEPPAQPHPGCGSAGPSPPGPWKARRACIQNFWIMSKPSIVCWLLTPSL